MSFLQKKSITVESSQVGERLDKFLATIEDIRTRSRAAQLIDDGRVLLNGKKAKASVSVNSGDRIEIVFPEPKASELIPLDRPLDIVYEDKDLIVVNKPSGLVVHPSAGHEQDTLVNILLAHTKDLSMGFNEQRPGIVHRIDKETSGLLVIAKNDLAHEALAKQFRDHSIQRVYQAAVFFSPKDPQGKIESNLARHPIDRKKYASVRSESSSVGKHAVTHYKVLSRNHSLSLIELKLETGRTHQIRVHLSEMGHPLIGDSLYGADKKIKNLPSVKIRSEIQNLDRFLLHAKELGFVHPKSLRQMSFSVEWPENDLALLREWGLLK